MKINSTDFRVEPGAAVRLADWPTAIKPICKSGHGYKKLLAKHVEKLAEMQQLHYASGRQAMLLVFQGRIHGHARRMR